MYVIVHSKSGEIFGFGLTPEKAMDHFLRGLLSYDGPRLDTRRCSPALYRRLQALEREGKFFIDCGSTVRALQSAQSTCLGLIGVKVNLPIPRNILRPLRRPDAAAEHADRHSAIVAPPDHAVGRQQIAAVHGLADNRDKIALT
jgi:hypothetical protein